MNELEEMKERIRQTYHYIQNLQLELQTKMNRSNQRKVHKIVKEQQKELEKLKLKYQRKMEEMV